MVGRPTALAVITPNLPAALTTLDRWVTWRYHRDGTHWHKVPKDCKTGRYARVTDPACWSSFDTARETFGRRKRDRPDGIGFVFAAGDGLVGVDLDRCRDPGTGEIEPWAADIIGGLDTYTEVSPSGTGVKLVVRGTLPPHGRRTGAIEMYSDRRFFTLTGHRLEGVPAEVRDRGEAVLDLHGRLFPRKKGTPAPLGTFPMADYTDEAVATALLAGECGPRAQQLLTGDWSGYASQSEADIALCGYLARAVGPDPGRIERLFGKSGLADRWKWQGAPEYRQRTVGRAVQGLAEFGASRRAATSLTKTFQEHSEHANTHGGDGSPEVNEGDERTSVAIDDAMGLIDEQGGQGDDFAVAFTLARRLLKYGERPEPFAEVVRSFCAGAGREFDEFWVQFLLCWSKVRSAEGAGDWAWAEAEAVHRPIEFLPGTGFAVNRVATLAYRLSLLKAQFPFPVDKVGAACGMSPMMGSKLINLLAQRKVLKKVRDADRHAHEAAEYVFLAPLPTVETSNVA